jgi:hypothetical protein
MGLSFVNGPGHKDLPRACSADTRRPHGKDHPDAEVTTLAPKPDPVRRELMGRFVSVFDNLDRLIAQAKTIQHGGLSTLGMKRLDGSKPA